MLQYFSFISEILQKKKFAIHLFNFFECMWSWSCFVLSFKSSFQLKLKSWFLSILWFICQKTIVYFHFLFILLKQIVRNNLYKIFLLMLMCLFLLSYMIFMFFVHIFFIWSEVQIMLFEFIISCCQLNQQNTDLLHFQ